MVTERTPPPTISISEFINAKTDKRTLVSTVVNRFTTDFLRRAYQTFDGDLVMALVFGEIAQYNFSRALRKLMAQNERQHAQWKDMVKSFELEKVAPCNALSISEATGIPRETVRRKVREMERRGWLRREGTNRLSVSPGIAADLQEFTLEILKEFVATMNLMRDLPETVAKHLEPKKTGRG